MYEDRYEDNYLDSMYEDYSSLPEGDYDDYDEEDEEDNLLSWE